MSTRLVAYKHLLHHVSVIQDILGQTCTHTRAFSSQASIPVAKQCCKHNLKLQTCFIGPQNFLASHHKSSISLPPPNSHILAPQTSLPVTHSLTNSHQRSEGRIQENLIEKVVRGMSTTPVERNPKRPREQDFTPSPPPKKTYHCKSSLSSDGKSCVDELTPPEVTPCCQLQPEVGQTGTSSDTEIYLGGVFKFEERTVEEEFTPEEETANELNPEGATAVETTAGAVAESRNTTASGSMRPSIPSEPILPLGEPVSSAKEMLEDAKGRVSSNEVKGIGHQKEKKLSKKRKKRKHSGEKADVRPNYFVGIQISNPAIHQGLLKVQEDLVAWDESLLRALVDVATSHITLLVAHLDSEESIAIACAALEESARRLRDGVSACPLRLTFTGIGNFSNQVVFACMVEDDQHQRLLDMAECVRKVFAEHSVYIPDAKDLHPHLTIAKLSKAPRTKKKQPVVRKIDPSCYNQHLDLNFGTQTVAGLQLLSMNKAKDSFRYYHSDKQVLFDVKLEEEKDHSNCCIPRRPILPLTLQRTYSTAIPQEEEESGFGNWVLPVAGVVTLVAGALVLGFALSRLRGNQ